MTYERRFNADTLVGVVNDIYAWAKDHPDITIVDIDTSSYSMRFPCDGNDKLQYMATVTFVEENE